MQLIDDVAVKLTLPPELVARIASEIPRSEALSATELIVAWDHDEATLLAQICDEMMGPVIPSPILRDYTWPGLYTPFEHQKTTASFLSIRHRAHCFNEAGTGKTSAAIWASDHLMNLGRVKRVLVVCPLSIMHSAWQADIFNTAMHRSVGVAHGDAKLRRKILHGSYEFVIINFDGIPIVSREIDLASFDLIIIDEANAYKNPSTVRWKTLYKLLKPSTRLWLMTGTPASQSPEDAYGLARLVSPERVPKFITAWRDVVMIRKGPFKWIPRPNARDEVFKALQPAIRFTKKECLDLPEVTYQTRDVPMTAQVAKYYNELRKELLITAAGEDISAVNAAASLSKLLQISGGASYTDAGNVVEFDIRPRLTVLEEILDESAHKVVVFVPYLHTIDIVADYLTSKGYVNEIIKGDVPPKKRFEIITRFQTQGNPRVLVIQPQAASHGITLTAADTMVFWSPVMSVETFLQCVGRIDRVGQKNPMTVVKLQSSEAEKRVYKMLEGKIDGHMNIVNLYKQMLEE